MAEDNELEKRAIEELLRETDRARVRAETMGPAGWLKCPLRSTNKRFLLNTLRSTGLQRRTGEPGEGHPAARGRLGSQTPDGSRDRSGSPPRDRRSNGGRADHNNPHRDVGSYDKNEDGDKERSYRHRGRRPGDDGQSRSRAHK